MGGALPLRGSVFLPPATLRDEDFRETRNNRKNKHPTYGKSLVRDKHITLHTHTHTMEQK